jgi:phosphoglycerate kinase
MNDILSLRKLGPEDIRGKRALVRLDLNVPIKDEVVQEDFRIRKIVPTVELLRKMGAKVILISHLEGENGPETLAPVHKYLSQFVDLEFFAGKVENALEPLAGMRDGDVLLLENLRLDEGEKKNSEAFSRSLAALADMYVNEAFAVSHRAHASIVGIPKYLPSYAGMLFEDEITNLSKVFEPQKPFVMIFGGLKFGTKIPLVKKFLQKADKIFLYGALAHPFFRAMGYEIGKSAHDEIPDDFVSIVKNKIVSLPVDLIVSSNGDRIIKGVDKILPDETIVDAGPESLKAVREAVRRAGLVVWNGPIGKFELGYSEGTGHVALSISNAPADSIVGGGDTVAVLNKLKMLSGFGFVSTGGGAMLDFLANETLPGIEALRRSE